MAKKNILVSVVIATKNEEKNIGNCLDSIKNQTYPNIEIIVVDSNSIDKTKKIAKKYTKKVYDIKGLNLSKIKNFRGAQINLGVKKSKGDFIFFPDADMTFDKNLVEEVVKKSNKFDAFYVPEIIYGKGFFGKIRNFERSFYNGTCIDAIRFVKRDLFLKVRGFDERNIVFGPDDWDFTKKIKKITNRLSITESKKYHHEEWLDIKTYLNKKKEYANTFEGYVKKWGENDPNVKKQLGPFYRLFGVFIENRKWIKLLRRPILVFGMYWIRLRVGLNYVMGEK